MNIHIREETHMKKKLILILMAGMMVTAFPSQVMADKVDDRIAEIKKEISTLQSELQELESSKEDSADPENKNGKIEIVAEYTLPDGLDWYTLHYYVVKNNSDKTVDINTSSLAYSSDGTMVGAADASLNALGPGCTSVFCEAFETSKPISSYETDFKETPSEYYDSVIQDLSFVQNDIDGGAIFQVTNNGTEAADFVEGYALFFQGDSLVACESTYFADDDSELKPGETISEQITAYVPFDRIEFYLTGRR